MSKILIIEDSRMIYEQLKTQLTAQGYKCVTVTDGLEGLKTAKKIAPDLIVLDVMLPSMNGFKICRLLKFDKRYLNTPIIMLTSRSENADRKLGISTGADVYMTKPFEFENLLTEIRRLLRDKSEVKQSV